MNNTLRAIVVIASLSTVAAVAFPPTSHARSATWVGSNGVDWNDPNNWSPQTVPNGRHASAIFNATSDGIPTIISLITLDGMIFEPGCPTSFTLEVESLLIIRGTGVVNNS